MSMFWRIEIAKVAVFPVPDWACAITSCPVVGQIEKQGGVSMVTFNTRNYCTLLNSRGFFKTEKQATLKSLKVRSHLPISIYAP